MEGWNDYAPPARLVKRRLLDSSPPADMSSFELLQKRKPQSTLDMLVPLMDDSEMSGGLNALVGQRR